VRNAYIGLYECIVHVVSVVCLFSEESEPTPQRGIYEPAREVKDYAAFAPPTNGGQQLEMSHRYQNSLYMLYRQYRPARWSVKS